MPIGIAPLFRAAHRRSASKRRTFSRSPVSPLGRVRRAAPLSPGPYRPKVARHASV